MVVYMDNQMHLWKMNLMIPSDGDLGFQVRLDRRLRETDVGLSYSTQYGITTVSLPFPMTDAVVIREDQGTAYELAPDVINDGSELLIQGDITGDTLYIGVPIPLQVDFTPPVYRRQLPDGGSVPMPYVTLKVRDWTFQLGQTGPFNAAFTPQGRDPINYTFSPITLGAYEIGSTPIAGNAEWRIKTTTRNTTWALSLTTSSHLPITVLGAEWRALATSKGR
jgi:hypothetical protein